MDPSKNLGLLSSLEIPNNTKSDAIKAPYPLWFQSFPRQNMYQSNHQLYPLQHPVIRPPNWFAPSPNYDIVNSSAQRPCSFPPQQQYAQNGHLPYYMASGVFRQAVPNPTLKAGILNNNWQDNKVLKTLAKPQSLVQSTAVNGTDSTTKKQIANNFCSSLYNYQKTLDSSEKKFSEKHDPTNRSYSKPHCSNNVTPPSVCCDRNGNEVSQLTPDVIKRYHPYSRKTSASESDSAWSKKSESRSPGLHCQNTFSIQRSPESNNIIKTKDNHVGRSQILQESTSKLESKHQYHNETENTLPECQCSGHFNYTTNVCFSKTQEELSPRENETEQKNAEELLLSMANRRVKINRLLEEQKRLMENLNVMKTGSQENSHQHGTA